MNKLDALLTVSLVQCGVFLFICLLMSFLFGTMRVIVTFSGNIGEFLIKVREQRSGIDTIRHHT